MKKMLMTASVPSMIGQFNMNNISILLDLGYEVHVGTNFKDCSYWPKERIKDFIKELKGSGVKYHQIDYSRSPKDIRAIVCSFMQVDRLLRKEKFEFVHCHTPMAGVVSRICCHRNGVKVIYTAHGFHFYDGAPLQNWLVYYPIEKMLSRWTDILITINKEDYKRAKEKFHAKRMEYIPGVGIDTEKFKPRESSRDKIRSELGLSNKQTMLLSVGELNENKNHETVIRAIKGMDLTYVIVGKGKLKEKLVTISKECGVDLRLMGFRNDVADFYDAADIYILPSIREGLNVSLMEAMASCLACCVGDIRGNRDLVDEKGGVLFNPQNMQSMRKAVEKIIKGDRGKMGSYNLKKIRKFEKNKVEIALSNIYQGKACI